MSHHPDHPSAMSAEVHVLFNGYAASRVASTVGYIHDGDAHVVVDPGMVPDPAVILDSLAALGVPASAVTDVIFSHHHPDHTLHAALFPNARFHDQWAIYKGDVWTSRPAEHFAVSPSILLIETPGHSPQDITTLAGTPDGIVAFSHLWWHAEGPVEDPRATDLTALHTNRARVLSIPSLVRIVPGHGPSFTPDTSTPR